MSSAELTQVNRQLKLHTSEKQQLIISKTTNKIKTLKFEQDKDDYIQKNYLNPKVYRNHISRLHGDVRLIVCTGSTVCVRLKKIFFLNHEVSLDHIYGFRNSAWMCDEKETRIQNVRLTNAVSNTVSNVQHHTNRRLADCWFILWHLNFTSQFVQARTSWFKEQNIFTCC